MVSSKDVAKRAGVSQSTVSRVLNQPDKVSKNNLDKVVKAMKELNYRPNSIARSLVNKQTKTIALISGPLHNPFFVETTTSIINYAHEQGYNINVYFEGDDNTRLYESVLSMQVDGILLSSMFMDDPIYYELQSLNVPFVMFNRKHNKGGHFVEIDNVKAGKLAANHLLSLGHTRVGFIGGPLYTSTFYGRYTGFLNEMKHVGYIPNESMVVETNTSKKEIREAVLYMMSQKDKPTAIFAATDGMAIFAIDILIELGYTIPEDISICGMDNVMMTRHQLFEMTTIGHKGEKNLGRLGIEYLISLIEAEETPRERVELTMEPVLYERKTTGKPNISSY